MIYVHSLHTLDKQMFFLNHANNIVKTSFPLFAFYTSIIFFLNFELSILEVNY